jgi:RNA polymerase sigma-70 factor (ECF subfamily)
VKQKGRGLDGAFTDFVRDYQKAAFSVAYGKVRNVHDAEDIIQEVFAEAYRKKDKLKTSNRTSAWLFKLIAYRCNDHLRKKIRREKRELDYVRATNNDREGQYDADCSDGLFEAIELLPEKYLVLVMLRYFADLSYVEISRMTGLSRATIDHRLRAAKNKLREQLDDAREGGDQV